MEEKKLPTFLAAIVAIILGSKLYKQFDVETFRFEKPLIATIYLITFVGAIVILVKSWMRRKPDSTGN